MKKLLLVLPLLLSLNAFAVHFMPQFNSFDQNCPDWNDSRFEYLDNYFTVGVDQSTKVGFDYEVPITRREVDAVWCAATPSSAKQDPTCKGIVDLNSDRPFAKYAGMSANAGQIFAFFIDREDQLNTYLSYTLSAMHAEGINHPNVGAILELLSRYYLQEMTDIYPKNQYRIVGGIEYKMRPDLKVMGELDIIVYDRETCHVVALGEAKAASKQVASKRLKKAKEQLQRFKNAIR